MTKKKVNSQQSQTICTDRLKTTQNKPLSSSNLHQNLPQKIFYLVC